MGLVAVTPAVMGLLGGAAVGGLLAGSGSVILSARGVAPTRIVRDYWKIRVLGDASLLARARGLASRSGLTLRRLATGAFEVQVPPPMPTPPGGVPGALRLRPPTSGRRS